MTISKIATFAFALLIGAVSIEPSMAKPGPAEYGGHATIRNLRISPDGKYVAMIANDHDNDVVTISKIGGGICKLGNGGNKVRGLVWANSERLAVVVSVTGRPAWWPSWYKGEWSQPYSVDVNCKNAVKLNGNSIIGRTPDGEVLMEVVSLNDTTESAGSAGRWTKTQSKITVHKVNPYTGKGPRYENGSDFTYAWAADASGRVRFRSDYDDGNFRTITFARIGESSEWVRVHDGRDFKDLEDSEFDVLGVGLRPDTALVRTRNGGDRYGIFEFDLRSKVFTRPVFQHPRVDVSGVVYGGSDAEPIGASYVDDIPKTAFFDKTYAQMQADLEATFPGENARVVSVSTDRKQYIAYVEGATNPAGVFHYVDTSSGEISAVGKAYPALTAADVGSVKYFTYPARDGLAIPAYLTLPNGSSGRNLPLVVMPHGGPEARDVGGYDQWAQFLASRGYAVLQPQFRGSDGYGKAFRNAGRREWGLKTQNDISDGVKHLTSTGVADGARVCIVGWSYGGYATLAGMTLTPELYRCGVAGAGVADLPKMLAWESKNYGRDLRDEDYWVRVMGHPIRDSAKLEAASPARLAANIRGPILMIHGKDDTVVPLEQSQIMLDAMKAANKNGQLVVVGGDDHWLSKSTTGVEFFTLLDSFLGTNLK
ncbi:MAG: S9 family peptidase [Micropepsaceae bacterium]